MYCKFDPPSNQNKHVSLFFFYKAILHNRVFLFKNEADNLLKPTIWFPTVVFAFSKMQTPLGRKL